MLLTFAPGVGFSWTSKQGEEITVEYPFPEPEVMIPPEESLVYVLWAEGHKESEVVQVSIDGKNNGWFFTVSAMISNQTEDELPYFRSAVWAVMAHLIHARADEIAELCFIRGSLCCSLSDFLSDDLSILTLHKPRLSEKLLNKPNSIVPQLLSRGIFLYVDERTKSLATPQFRSLGARFNLLSDIAVDQFSDFHVDLLVNHIPYVESEVFKFYLYYQIIESLMEVVAIEVCQDTLAKIAASNGDPMQSYEILSRHKDRSSEKFRISQVFNNFLSSSLDCTDILRDECMNFTLSVDSSVVKEELDKNKNVASHLYSVRNQLIHNFRRVGSSTAHLKRIVEVLDLIVPDLLCKFRRVALAPESVADV